MRRLCLRERRSARVVPGLGSTPAAPVGVELPDPPGHRPDSRQAVTQVSMQQRPVKGPALRRHPGGVLQEEARHGHGMERPPRRLPGMIQREKLVEKLVARPRRDNPAALSAPSHARCSHSAPPPASACPRPTRPTALNPPTPGAAQTSLGTVAHQAEPIRRSSSEARQVRAIVGPHERTIETKRVGDPDGPGFRHGLLRLIDRGPSNEFRAR
jgi:hypothetical protein